jgi:hypothetical protein
VQILARDEECQNFLVEFLMDIYSEAPSEVRAGNDSRPNQAYKNADNVNRLTASGMYTHMYVCIHMLRLNQK